jgi:D-lactate dehydrogenase
MRDFSKGKIAKWDATLPKPISIDINFEQKVSNKKVVYFPSCINRTMGLSDVSVEEKQLFEVTVELLQKAGYQIIFPEDLPNLCCGMPFSSKGFNEAGNTKSKQLEKALIKATKNGEYPVLCDMSPCTKTMVEKFKSNLKLYEPIEFAMDFLAKDLDFTPINEPITIHTTCSSRKMGLDDKFRTLAYMCANEVIIPADVNCCGFAGDRGFNYPELNESALRDLPKSIKNAKYAFSTSKTCEIGLSEHSGLDYNSIFYLINRCTKRKNI